MLTQQKNPKSIGITAVMNNPKLAKTIADAMQSPPGSTKRQNAAAILRSINKMNPSYIPDGQGGFSVAPAPSYQGTLQVQQPQQQPTLSVQGKPTAPQQPQQATTGQMLQGGVQPALQGEIAPAGKFIFPSAPAKNENALPLPADSLAGGVDFGYVYNKLSPEMQEKYKPIFDIYESSFGPESFAMKMFSDVNNLQKVPGLENTPISTLIGATLPPAQQAEELKKTLKEEFQINQKQDNLRKLSDRGMDIADNLQEYINGRDEYLKRIDSMIDSTKSSMIDMDLANPYVSSAMNQYMNYLYILKGKQQKRYANFLDSAIREHNFELVRAQNEYDSTYQRFQDEFNSRRAITEEDYNRMNTMLQEMYNNIDQREKKDLDMQKLRNEVLKSAKDLANTTLDILTPDDVDEINSFENIIGFRLPDTVWNYIYRFVPSSTTRAKLTRKLLAQLKSTPNMTEEEIIAFVDDWLNTEEAGGGSIIDPSTGEVYNLSS